MNQDVYTSGETIRNLTVGARISMVYSNYVGNPMTEENMLIEDCEMTSQGIWWLNGWGVISHSNITIRNMRKPSGVAEMGWWYLGGPNDELRLSDVTIEDSDFGVNTILYSLAAVDATVIKGLTV